jgi:hypothetical protein
VVASGLTETDATAHQPEAMKQAMAVSGGAVMLQAGSGARGGADPLASP